MNLIKRADYFEVSCEKSCSGYMAIAFCRYCRNDCELAGKPSDEIHSLLHP